MEKGQLFDTILKSAVGYANRNLPTGVKFQKSDGEEWSVVSNVFFNFLQRNLNQNGMFTTDDSVLPEKRNAARASAFAISVLNSLFIADNINNGIDEFFIDERNDALFEGKTEEQKQELKNELKNYVKDTLAVKAKTDEGKAFVKKFTDEFDTITRYQDEQKMNPDRGNNNIYGKSKEFMDTSLSMLYALNEALTENTEFTQALNKVADNHGRDNVIVNMIFDAMKDNSAALASEEEVYEHTVRNLDFAAENNLKVKPLDYIQHFKDNSLSEDEREWAINVFKDIPLDYKNIMLNGKPMFSEDKVKYGSRPEMVQEIAAEILSGNEVTVKDPENGKLTLLNPITDDTKSFWQKIIEFFADLLGISLKEKEKEDAIKDNISKNLNEFKEETKQREKLSYDELTGRNAIRKVESSTSHQNDLTNTNDGPVKDL